MLNVESPNVYQHSSRLSTTTLILPPFAPVVSHSLASLLSNIQLIHRLESASYQFKIASVMFSVVVCYGVVVYCGVLWWCGGGVVMWCGVLFLTVYRYVVGPVVEAGQTGGPSSLLPPSDQSSLVRGGRGRLSLQPRPGHETRLGTEKKKINCFLTAEIVSTVTVSDAARLIASALWYLGQETLLLVYISYENMIFTSVWLGSVCPLSDLLSLFTQLKAVNQWASQPIREWSVSVLNVSKSSILTYQLNHLSIRPFSFPSSGIKCSA